MTIAQLKHILNARNYNLNEWTTLTDDELPFTSITLESDEILVINSDYNAYYFDEDNEVVYVRSHYGVPTKDPNLYSPSAEVKYKGETYYYKLDRMNSAHYIPYAGFVHAVIPLQYFSIFSTWRDMKSVNLHMNNLLKK